MKKKMADASCAAEGHFRSLFFSLCFIETYKSSLRLDQRPIYAIHFVVKSARVAQIVSSAISPPQWSRNCSAVYTLPALRKIVRLYKWKRRQLRLVTRGREVPWLSWRRGRPRCCRSIVRCCSYRPSATWWRRRRRARVTSALRARSNLSGAGLKR